MFPLHNLDEVVDNTNIFGFLRAISNLQHVAKFRDDETQERQVSIYRFSVAMVCMDRHHFLCS